MGLKDARRLFYKIRDKCQIIVKKHAFADYPERGFSEREILHLVRSGSGPMEVNRSHEAIPGSHLFFPKDDLDRECKLVILIQVVEIEDKELQGEEQIIVCSAYRELKK